MKPRILLVSTYHELSIAARKIANEMEIPILIHEGGIMRNGHEYAQKHESEFDVIISQGGTAAVIQKLVKIPVVTIEISTVDILKGLAKAKEYGNKIGLVCHKTEQLDALGNLEDILNVDFNVFPYSDREELDKQIKGATAEEKMTVVAMGGCIVDIAQGKNLNSVLITSNEKAIEKAITTAQNICDLGKREKERSEWLKAIVDYSGEGIVTIDQNQNIITINPVAEKICGLSAYEVIGRRISDIRANSIIRTIYLDESYEPGKIYKTGNIQVVANKVAIMVDDEPIGTAVTMQEVAKLQKLEQKVRAELYTKGLVAKHYFSDIIGQGPVIQDVIEHALRFGKTSTTILIEGETGSGKELFAQSMHNISRRSNGPFVAINCAALPENLLESELFGYEEGAFTGAKKGGKQGLFELADKGTIFLDEIGEIPMSLQSRLLRVLQEKEVMRIGGDSIMKVDVRVMAATNLNLYKMVEEGKFREDLYFRINVLNLKVPPLRKRREDIPQLVNHFITDMNHKHGTDIKGISQPAMDIIVGYYWPGNVRELENFVEKAVILCRTTSLEEPFIDILLKNHATYKEMQLKKLKDTGDSIVVKIGQMKDMEMQIFDAINKSVKGNKILMAEKLGISRTTLWKRLKELEEELDKDMGATS